ncbi:Phosphatidylglycerophosphate synthase [Porphyromonadaceae bacterium NLAE-zl-C104]|uniref:CDP-alcohol phosphatidyltransferase n=1 Tax=Proteiniphilum TaxID=294702 RepID=UPI0008F243A4|nr:MULTISPECIES: CDP-alcohol phosphatidyltransferase [Proteiniphilum]MDY9917267.1 CDP-alcohol phosphatidyltransferase [Proteiniphilum sp.]SFS40311.1 Phosphatidylglycerophosphate synthase [Porphyromonadaceae bacterium NLAE-zl-C104]
MKNNRREMVKSLKLIAKDRERTNILREWEQKSIAYLVQKVPSWISSDGLTAIGFFGNIMVASSFVMGAFINRYLLLVSLLGFVINWIGDSLDGRLAYYRNKPRKWYGFSLDVTVDWIGTFIIGLGYTIYAPGLWKYVGFLFVVLYGWEMITAQLRYKIGGQYSIDSGIFGPTEVRLLLGTIITVEVFVPGSIQYLASIACLVLLVSNLIEASKLLKLADERDKTDRQMKEEEYKKKRTENA